MKLKIYIYLLIVLGIISCKTQKINSNYESESLKVEKLTKNTFRHISYIETEDFGKVGCNGMIVIGDREALIIDTPTNNIVAKELIDWLEYSLKYKVIGVVVTHFHEDCLGGLDEFHKRQIPSYASFKTIEIAKLKSLQIPQIGFENYLEIKVGDKKVVNEFFGEGHTSDNIVSYFQNEKVLFGGCLIKANGASKGYVGDANIYEWSNTVKAIKSKYKNAEIIIPGHGKPGDMELLDYTIQLFNIE